MKRKIKKKIKKKTQRKALKKKRSKINGRQNKRPKTMNLQKVMGFKFQTFAKAYDDFKKKIKLWYTLASKNAKLKYKRNYWKGAAKPKDDVHYLLKKIGDLDPPGHQGQLVPESLRQASGSIRLYYQPREMFTKNE